MPITFRDRLALRKRWEEGIEMEPDEFAAMGEPLLRDPARYLGIEKQTVQGTAITPASPIWRSLDCDRPRDEQGRYLITDERAEAQWLAWQTEIQARICAIFGVSPEALTSAQRDDISDLLSFIDGRYSGE